MAIPVSYSELYGNRPTDNQLRELISPFKTEPTFISLAMWSLMLSLFEDDAEKYRYLQGFFIHNLIRENVRERVKQAATLDSESARPVFGRWQLLALMKRVLLETTQEGDKDPRYDPEARYILGDACLMLSDLLFTEEQEGRLKGRQDPKERERIHDELMTQWLFQFELLRVPDVFQSLARSNEYFSIFDHRAAELKFSNGQSLGQRLKHLTGLEMQQYLDLYFGIYVLHNDLQGKHQEEINANPGIINFDKERIFSKMDVGPKEREAFFRRVLIDLPSLTESVKNDIKSDRLWQFDFTTFRNFPLIYNSDSKRAFTCLAFPFLIEKLASGVYHTIMNSLGKGDRERTNFLGYWGKVFEQFVNDRLREEYPSSTLANQFYSNPYFNKKKNHSIEVSDSVLDYGDSLVLMEYKGGYLSLDEKYSDNADKLLTGIAKKFGVDKAIKQLSRSIGMLFNEDEQNRDTFSELDEKRRPIYTFRTEDVTRVIKVYPVLLVQDYPMTFGFIIRRLRLQFAEKIQEYKISPKVQVRPLSVLTIEHLEDILEHLKEVNLTDILDEYAREEHQPLTTLSSIFEEYLKARGIQQRRYRWSVKRNEEIFDKIKKQFITED